MSAALDMLEKVNKERFSRYSELFAVSGLGPMIEGRSIDELQTRVRAHRDMLMSIAHHGRAAAVVTRKEIEHTNHLICEVGIWLESSQPTDFRTLDLVSRFSPSQKMIWGIQKSIAEKARRSIEGN
jgi:hypothetical protein